MVRRATYEPDQAALLSFIGIFFPPITVAIVKGWHRDVAINFGLWILGAFPGMIHAFWIVGKHTRPSPNMDPESLWIESTPPSSSLYDPIYNHHQRNHQQSPLITSVRGEPFEPPARGSNESSIGTTATAPQVPQGILSPFGDYGSVHDAANPYADDDLDKKV